MRAAPAYLVALTVLAGCMATPQAFAVDLPLDASYGNRDGCLYANTGETNGADDFTLLTNEGITTAASYCEFKTIIEAKGDSLTVTATCRDEGEDSDADFRLTMSRVDNAYTIKFDDGTTWGPLKRCK